MHVRIEERNKNKLYRLAQKHNLSFQTIVNIILEGVHPDDICITVHRRKISKTVRPGRNRGNENHEREI